jgi:hypothetical protein
MIIDKTQIDYTRPPTYCWNCNKQTGYGFNVDQPKRYDTIVCSTECKKALDNEGWKPCEEATQ